MLGGRSGSQMTVSDLDLWTTKGSLVPEEGFYKRFGEAWRQIVRDEDFASLYNRNRGRPSVSPALVAGACLLGLRDSCSDREVEERMRFDLRYKVALGLSLQEHGCDHSTLCVFRARLLTNGEDAMLFKKILAAAVEKGLLPKVALKTMDSSPMLGAAAQQDTYKLIRTALHKLVKAHEKKIKGELKGQLGRYVKTGKADIDWNDAEARKQELQRLVKDAETALQELPSEGEGPRAHTARELLRQVAAQDVEADGVGGVQIRKGVAKDRVISTVDPEMRHGHKTSAGHWNGHKKHVTVEPTSEFITAVTASAANVPDAAVALELLEQQKSLGLESPEVVGDMAYGSGKLRAEAQERGSTFLTRAPAEVDDGRFKKAIDFDIDLEAGTVTCPNGVVRKFRFRPGKEASVTFPRAICAECPLAEMCLSSPGHGRTVTINAHEDQLQQAAARRQEADFAEKMSQRPVVERKQAHLNARGGRKARYIGLKKATLQVLLSAAMVNFENLLRLGAFESPESPLEAVAAA